MTNLPLEYETISLDEALSFESSTARPVKTFIGQNTGNRTLTLLLSLWDLQEITEVANDPVKHGEQIAQRKLDINHATSIAKYLLKGLLFAAERKNRMQGKPITPEFEEIMAKMGTQPYLSIPPLVASWRDCGPNGTKLRVEPLKIGISEVAAHKIFVSHGSTFWIVDGQHRRKGVQLVYDFFKHILTYRKYPARASLYNEKSKNEIPAAELSVWQDCYDVTRTCHVNLEVHLGLTIEQERQLFHDLNTLGKKVDQNLAHEFDQSNPVNKFITEAIIQDIFESENLSLAEKGDWDETGLTRKELIAINSLLFLNKTNVNGATPALIDPKTKTAQEFWERVVRIENFSAENSKHKTVAAQPVVLKALAKLTFDFVFGKNQEWVTQENADKILRAINSLDFSHQNPMWRYYELNEGERTANGLDGLKDYLPSEADGNRDIGKYDETNSVFRFGAKHNDIHPIIGDMIRWKLGLPSRKKS
jgi:hypothetical protein